MANLIVDLIPQRFAPQALKRKHAWVQCDDHNAQRWLVVAKRGQRVINSQHFKTKRAAMSWFNLVLARLSANEPTQKLSARYDTSLYRGAVYSSKPVPTAKVTKEQNHA